MKCIVTIVVLITLVNTSLLGQVPAKDIPAFTFKKLDNTEFSNKNIASGKLSFFVFFDSECDHCHHAMQYINQHYAEFKTVAIYLISLDSLTKIKQVVGKYGGNLKSKKNVTLLQDSKNEFIVKFGPKKYPSLFLYSAQKKLMRYDDNEQNLPDFIKQIKRSVK